MRRKFLITAVTLAAISISGLAASPAMATSIPVPATQGASAAVRPYTVNSRGDRCRRQSVVVASASTSSAVECTHVQAGLLNTAQMPKGKGLPANLTAVVKRAHDREQKKMRALAATAQTSTVKAAARSSADDDEPLSCNWDRDAIQDLDRFTVCSEVDWWAYTYTETDGAMDYTGTIQMSDFQSVQFLQNSGVPGWDHDIYIDPLAGWGTFEDGIEGSVVSTCGGSNSTTCLVYSSDPPQGVARLFANDSSNNLSWEEGADSALQVAGLRDDLSGALGVTFTGAIGTMTDNGSFQGEYGVLPGRCDTEVSGRAPGCVNPAFTPTLTFSSLQNPLVTEVAQHVYAAQRSLDSHPGVPGSGTGPDGEGSPLHHLTDDALTELNRATACPSGAVPAGKSCDEYPMASTYEGAYTTSIPDEFSVAGVDETANHSQGGLTGGFYQNNRVLDDDPFWVNAVLPDGTPSW